MINKIKELLSNKAWLTCIILALAIIIGLCSIRFFGNDNEVEEACEQVIESTTGVDIDLTP
jgi:hypothetical protein